LSSLFLRYQKSIHVFFVIVIIRTRFGRNAAAQLQLRLGASDEAERLFAAFWDDFGKYELEMQQYYDHYMAGASFSRMFKRFKENIPGL